MKKIKRLKQKSKYLSLLDIDFNIFFENKEESELYYWPSEKPTWNALIKNDAERNLVEHYENNETDTAILLEEDGADLLRVLTTCLTESHNELHRNYLIRMIFDLTKVYPGNVVLSYEKIYNQLSGGLKLPFGHFLRLLREGDENYAMVSKLLVLQTFIMMNMNDVTDDDKDKIFIWYADTLEKTNNKRIKLVLLTTLSTLVKSNHYRTYFEDHRRIVKILTRSTEYKPQETVEQILYQTLNTLWVLTFNDKVKKKNLPNAI